MSTFQDAVSRKKALIEAAKARTAKPDALATTPKQERKIEYIPPEQATNKMRVVFDNSGSMSGQAIKDAKKGVVEYLRNCTVNKDAVAIHLLEQPYSGRVYDEDEDTVLTNLSLSPLLSYATLTTDLVQLASAVDSPANTACGGTPFYAVCLNALREDPQATRVIAFSDGEPNYDDRGKEEQVIATAKEKKVPIDTVFFGSAHASGASLLQRLAEATGGIFLVFDSAKGVNFADAFKYLSPVKRLMLMDASFKAALQRGEVK